MKRDRHSGIQWNRVLRRSAALLMVTAALWALLTAAGAGAAAEAFKALGEDGGFVSAILRAELGEVEGAGGPFDALDRWGQLVVGQSSLLRSNEEAVAQWLAGEMGGDGTENDEQEKPAEPSPTPEAEDPEDPANLPEVTTAPDDIIARTLVPSSGVGYAQADGVYIYNTTDVAVDAAALASAQVNITLGDPSEPQILIMHTHATEAYTPDGTDIYVQTDNSRTLDNTQNMVRIGEEMKEVFEEKGRGKTILMSSHMFEEVDRTCDRIGIIRDGRLVALDSAQALRERHVRTYTVTLDQEQTAAEFAREFGGRQDPEDPRKVTVTARQSLEEIFLHYYGGDRT